MSEHWADIKDYEGRYQISNLGRAKSLKRKSWNGHGWINQPEKILKQGDNGNGYHFVNLCKENKTKQKYVHRLVAQHFLTNKESKKTVNHKNGIKSDNRVENLEWATYKENATHAVRNGLHKDPVHIKKRKPFVCNENRMIYNSLRHAGNDLNIPHRSIGNVLKKKRMKTNGYTFNYI